MKLRGMVLAALLSSGVGVALAQTTTTDEPAPGARTYGSQKTGGQTPEGKQPEGPQKSGQQSEAPWEGDVARPTALLSQLHHAAEREVQMGDVGEVGGQRRETRLYAAELAAAFRAYDQRVLAFAAANGIDASKVDRVFAGENVVAMRRHADDLARLANVRGEGFDRDFWVTVAQEQAATADMLAVTVEKEPGLALLVSDMTQLLDRSSRRALVAAEATRASETPIVPEQIPGGAER